MHRKRPIECIFIKVINLDRLIENLNTIWIGRFHLFANPVRFERPKKPNLSSHNNAAAASSYPRGIDQAKGQFQTGSYVNVVNGSFPVGVHGPFISSVSVLVLDDSCFAERDLSNHVTGKVKDVSSISNLRTLIMEEGFSVVNLVYLGGLWVMIECDNVETKANMLQHTGVKSWFHVLQNTVHGEALDIEDNVDSSFGRKRLCIKTKLPLSILESFKVIFKGKVYMVRAKELFTWNPILLGQKEMEYTSDEDYDVGPQKVPDRSQFCEEGPNDDRVSDVEEVSETNFEDNSSIPINHIDESQKQQSDDPFNIYRLLRKQPGDDSHEVSSSLSIRNENDQSAKEIPVVVNAKVMNNSQDVYKEASCDNVDPNVVKKGGSVLGVMEDMIRVGKSIGLGHKMKKDEAVGNSGGILCVWEATVFKKDYATISDNFVSRKRILWNYISTLIDRWNGEVVVLRDFNEVRNIDERRGSCFNPTSARVFDQFISALGLVDVKMEGYMFTWSHPSGSKMSKLDWFLVSGGIFLIFPSIVAVCLDRLLSDHCPIILCEVQADFGPIPFRFYHYWISLEGFDAMVEQTWRSFSHNDANRMIRFKKKIQDLKVRIRAWIKDKRSSVSGENDSIKKELTCNSWSLCRGHWCTNPNKVKEAFFKHFEVRFKKPVNHRLKINFLFSKRLSDVQASDLERRVSRDEIRLAVWNCGENKSPGPDGYSFEFFIKYWNLVGSDLCDAVEYFFETESFPNGCNSSFVALILKITDAKFVNDFRPISLIGSVYKVVTKEILDGPFILNDLLHWCKRKKKQVMFFKVDFAKAYDSVRWDYLLDVLEAFGFGNIWRKWIQGTLSSAKASVLVNGSPTIEFPFHCGLKQGDPLSPYLFILIMISLNMSFTRAIDEGVFKDVHLHGSTSISHLFYADDVMFIGEWSDDNLKECMSRHNAWASTVDKLRSRLSKWKVKTLSIGGRLTLLKAVLGASPLYNMSIFKVPKGIINSMEAIRSEFFNGMEPSTNKITWVAWNKVLASNENGGFGVSSYHALNRALLLK
uniref:RNA-directed DNA polymerase, eukaryota n=1 Tax=Tanacetum cinerariifolium TaxID=118510 RepID=A0A699HAE8_TANCI|nr:RNA-directed DNA polymerase, eukaryota [Tanacetum cinerariifolium]